MSASYVTRDKKEKKPMRLSSRIGWAMLIIVVLVPLGRSLYIGYTFNEFCFSPKWDEEWFDRYGDLMGALSIAIWSVLVFAVVAGACICLLLAGLNMDEWWKEKKYWSRFIAYIDSLDN